MDPNAIARFKVEGNWVSPQIYVSAIYMIEVTFGCGGLDEASSSHEMVFMDSNNGNTLVMCTHLIVDLASRNDRKNVGFSLTFPSKWKCQLADCFVYETEIDGGMAQRRARTVTETSRCQG